MDSNSPHLTTRITLTRELNRLRDNVFSIGQNCCQSLALAVSSFGVSSDILEQKTSEFATQVQLSADTLENDCFTILSLQQPLLRDLRLVVGALHISTHLTRIANYSARLAVISCMISDKSLIPSELITIAETCQVMLSDVLRAFIAGSSTLALELVKKDKQIDLLHDSSFQKIIKRMAKERADLVEIDAQLLTSVRLLERTGDLISAIAKEVYFIYSGKKWTS